MTGWDLPDITDCLMSDPKGEITGLDDFVRSYPLSALSADKRYFVVIRDFSFHLSDAKVSMTNAQPTGEWAHKGMTLATAHNDVANVYNVVLPHDLRYKKVHLEGREIHIHHGEEKTITNFQEIRKLWTFYKLTEPEILKIFTSFENKFIEKRKIDRMSDATVDSDRFGLLTLNTKLDCYSCRVASEGDDIELSFSNVEKVQFGKNLQAAENLLAKVKAIENDMIDEMLPLKNAEWLSDHERELDRETFSKQARLYAVLVFEDGSASLYYHAGDLFWGHEILTSVDSAGRYKSSAIAG